jgi:Xaa-Pro aminopeptidase
MREAIAEARGAALNAVRPGAAANEVDKAARDVLKRYGFGDEFKHAAGHGVGFAAADPNALPRIRATSLAFSASKATVREMGRSRKPNRT